MSDPDAHLREERWRRYRTDRAWKDFWESDEVSRKVEQLEGELRNLNPSAPDALVKVAKTNAWLDAFEWLKDLPNRKLAEASRGVHTKPTTGRKARPLAAYRRLRTG